MNTYVALFRGINVGGNNILRMKELRELLEEIGLQNVKTYIQSGNVVFQSDADDALQLSERIRTAIKKEHGFEPRVLVLTVEEVQEAMNANPFPEAEPEPKTLHLNFLTSEPESPNLEALEEIKKDSERFHLQGRVFYLHARDGIGRSKLAAKTERLVGVPMTGRNWRTVSKIMEMAKNVVAGKP